MKETQIGRATTYTLSGTTATITLNRPDQRNVLSSDLLNSLGADLKRAEADPDCRVVVLANSGPAFCAGADLKSRGREPAPRYSFQHILSMMIRLPKPVVGKIAGHCIGGGIGLAAACDVSVVADDVLFGFTEVRIGVIPAVISVVCLPKLNRADALELFLSGERVSAERAREAGLVNRVVSRPRLNDEVVNVCRSIAAGAPGALTVAKRLVYERSPIGLQEALAEKSRLSAQLFAGPEAAEGMAAFRERRQAAWVPDKDSAHDK